MREQADELEFTKIKNLCFSEGTVKRIWRQATEWEKVFPKHKSDERLVPRKYQVLLNFIRNKQFNLKCGQKLWPDTSPKVLHGWQIGNGKMFNIISHQENAN